MSPIAITVEPTTACNLRCPECPSGLRSFTRPTGKLSLVLFKKLIDEIAPSTSWLTYYFQGEPYLHPEFDAMISYAHQAKMYTSTSTNAHFLNEKNAEMTVRSGLSRLIISIDGTTQATYEAYRKEGSLDKVLQGTRTLLNERKRLKSTTPLIIWQFLVVRQNEHEISEVKKLARQYGVDKLVFKTAQLYDFKFGNPLMPTNPKYSRYRMEKDKTFSIKNKLENHCWKMWSSSVITWDGQVIPCCFDKDAKYRMGFFHGNNTFMEIWTGNVYQQFRQNIRNGRASIDICRNCSEGTKVWSD